MAYRSKCEMQTIKSLEENMENIFTNMNLVMDFFKIKHQEQDS